MRVLYATGEVERPTPPCLAMPCHAMPRRYNGEERNEPTRPPPSPPPHHGCKRPGGRAGRPKGGERWRALDSSVDGENDGPGYGRR